MSSQEGLEALISMRFQKLYIRHVQTIYINIYSKYKQDIIGNLWHNYDNNKYF